MFFYYYIIISLIIYFIDGKKTNDLSTYTMFNNFDNIYKYKYIDNLNNDNNQAGTGRFDNREFTLFVNRKTWSEAMLECWRNNLEFVEVKTMNEARKLSRIMLKNRPDAIESIWVGAFEKTDGDNNYWKWLSGDNIQDDDELWKNPVDGNKKLRGGNECLLLDWHFWENPSFRKTPCDRKRGYICQKTIANNNSEELDFDQREDRRFLLEESVLNTTSTTTTATITTTADITTSTSNTTNSLRTTQMPISSEPVQVDVTKSQVIFTTSPTKFEKPNDSSLISNQNDYGDINNHTDWTNLTSLRIDISTESVSTASPMINLKKPSDNFYHQHKNKSNVEIEKPSSIPKKLKKKNNFQPLKLYYAFEGPVIVGLTSTVLPEDKGNQKQSRPKYHKYIVRRKNKKQRQQKN